MLLFYYPKHFTCFMLQIKFRCLNNYEIIFHFYWCIWCAPGWVALGTLKIKRNKLLWVVIAYVFAQEWMAKICISYLQYINRHMVNHTRCFLFKKSVMLNAQLKGTWRQTAALHGNKSILIPGDVVTDIWRAIWSFQRDCQFLIWSSIEHGETRGSSRLTLTV